MRRLLLAFALLPAAAGADFEGVGRELTERAHGAPGAQTEVRLAGHLRLRGEVLENLDLDRGLDPSGAPLYPVPLGDPDGQTLTHADLRLRTDLTILAPGSTVAVKLRVDLLDGLALGSRPSPAPLLAATSGQTPTQVLSIRRAWGEALTPLGIVAAGRMGNDWGLGMVANAGDCADCDHGDAADRLAFVTSLAGHLWAAAYDISAIGPTSRRRDASRLLDLDPGDDVRTVTFAVMRWRTDLTRERLARAGRVSLEYGALFSHRWQDRDVPASWLPTAQPMPIDAAQVMARGYRATAVDGWLRLGGDGWRVEAEAALLMASLDQASLIPGVLLAGPVTSTQLGAALESELRVLPGLVVGLDAGYASGDDAPGFGAFPGATAAAPGDLDGPQAMPPGDLTADNFRFHPDYRIDRILFRELVGAVTDALYLRPHLSYTLVDLGAGRLEAEVAVIASRAVEATSTPGGEAPLGIEVDPTLRYRGRDGFELSLEHAVLFPLAGLDNPAAGLPAKPAQLLRLRIAYVF